MGDCKELTDVDQHTSQRGVDNSSWDGAGAMSSCAGSSTPSSCYSQICAGKRSGDTSKQSSWALPHHSKPGAPPNANGVRNALARLSSTEGLINRAAAQRHLEAHMSAIQSGEKKSAEHDHDHEEEHKENVRFRPPRENLVRMVTSLQDTDFREIELRAAEGGDGNTMFGHFAVFNRWTHINSIWEGDFMERIAPGAFSKTINENRSNIKVLFQHGRDAQLGAMALGTIEELREDKTGAYYEVELVRGIPEMLVDGIRKKLYGASFRFRVVKEDLDNKPKRSDSNPDAIPERTIRELELMEFGPVTFPAYKEATAGVRSMTDEFMLMQLGADPARLLALIQHYGTSAEALQGQRAEDTPHSDDGSRQSESDGSDTGTSNGLAVYRNPNKKRRT